jgi:hypothetical protein
MSKRYYDADKVDIYFRSVLSGLSDSVNARLAVVQSTEDPEVKRLKELGIIVRRFSTDMRRAEVTVLDEDDVAIEPEGEKS